MFKKSKLLLFTSATFAIGCLNILIYWRSKDTLHDAILIFAECARNSGRTAAALNLFIIALLIIWRLNKIDTSATKKLLFQLSLFMFAINHVIHFYFVSKNFEIHNWSVGISDNLHGFITYLLILIAPVIGLFYRSLNHLLYAFFILHIINVTYFIGISFYGRIKPIDPAYMHQIGILIMFASILLMLTEIFRNWSKEFKQE
jgi:hypothetical protein